MHHQKWLKIIYSLTNSISQVYIKMQLKHNCLIDLIVKILFVYTTIAIFQQIDRVSLAIMLVIPFQNDVSERDVC